MPDVPVPVPALPTASVKLAPASVTAFEVSRSEAVGVRVIVADRPLPATTRLLSAPLSAAKSPSASEPEAIASENVTVTVVVSPIVRLLSATAIDTTVGRTVSTA